MHRFSFKPSMTIRGRESHGPRGWAGKPAHPPLTDVPIGAYCIAAVLDLVSFLGRNYLWSHDVYRAATFVLIAGAAVSLLTALTGFLDWRTIEHGTQVRRTANAHAICMLAVTGLVLVDLGVRWFGYWGAAYTETLPLVLSLGTAAVLFVGALLGGSLVYDYGFNVEAQGDSPVWHPSERDLMPGHQPAAGQVPERRAS
jgi:uncharacterized membrane protein